MRPKSCPLRPLQCDSQDLEHATAVLRSKIDVDARLARQAQTAATREREALQRHLVVAAADLEEKDKLYRAALLEVSAEPRGWVWVWSGRDRRRQGGKEGGTGDRYLST